MIFTMGVKGPGQTVTDEELLAVIRRLLAQTHEPVVTTRDVFETVPLSERRVRDRLERLAENGSLERSVVGGGIVAIYWVED